MCNIHSNCNCIKRKGSLHATNFFFEVGVLEKPDLTFVGSFPYFLHMGVMIIFIFCLVYNTYITLLIGKVTYYCTVYVRNTYPGFAYYLSCYEYPMRAFKPLFKTTGKFYILHVTYVFLLPVLFLCTQRTCT